MICTDVRAEKQTDTFLSCDKGLKFTLFDYDVVGWSVELAYATTQVVVAR